MLRLETANLMLRSCLFLHPRLGLSPDGSCLSQSLGFWGSWAAVWSAWWPGARWRDDVSTGSFRVSKSLPLCSHIVWTQFHMSSGLSACAIEAKFPVFNGTWTFHSKKSFAWKGLDLDVMTCYIFLEDGPSSQWGLSGQRMWECRVHGQNEHDTPKYLFHHFSIFLLEG